ncbi:hypothetical protein MRX96_008752 [Rhipicephalus microplus]
MSVLFICEPTVIRGGSTYNPLGAFDEMERPRTDPREYDDRRPEGEERQHGRRRLPQPLAQPRGSPRFCVLQLRDQRVQAPYRHARLPAGCSSASAVTPHGAVAAGHTAKAR